LIILTNATLARSNSRSLMMVITAKHVGAVLMPILMQIIKLVLKQFNCASVGGLKLFDMHLFIVEFYGL
jgi:hypothetical protein